jgi:hypothetical protein
MVLVEEHSSDTVVALVQTASLGPALLFACSPACWPICSTGDAY